MLLELGFDWLALELIESIQHSDERQLNSETLGQVRELVEAGVETVSDLDTAPTSALAPLVGDAQIKWAAHFIEMRVKTIFAEIDASIESISAIAYASDELKKSGTGHWGTNIVLVDGEASQTLSHSSDNGADIVVQLLGPIFKRWVTSLGIEPEQ